MPIEAIVLGRAQDAGVPQAGCTCQRCMAARSGSIPREYAACLAIVDSVRGEAWLIDAGPDFREQLFLLDTLRPGTRLAGIFITHAHIGHYVGLVHLGREAMNVAGLAVHGTPSVCDFLRQNAPWSQLVTAGNIILVEHEPTATVALRGDVRIELIPVPHRGEFSDTVAAVIRGAARALFYCPDIDSWEKWDRDVGRLPDQYDVSIIDGTFWSGDELPGRKMSDVPHPTVLTSTHLIGNGRGRVFFTHLNHTNPLISSPQSRQTLRAAGFDAVDHGQSFGL